MKKIMEVTEAFGSGVFAILAEICNGIVDKYEVHLVYPMRPDTPANYRDLLDKRIVLHEIPDLRDIYNPISVLNNIRTLKRLAEEIKPAIIHLHSSIFGFTGRMAFSGKKEKLFYTPHGYSFLMENYKPWKRKVFWWLEKISAIRNCTTISCSLSEHNETVKLTEKARLVENGINTEKLDKITASIKKKDHPLTVYTLGRISYQKNPELFNRVAKALPAVKFIWIGEGDMRGVLTSPNIEITGWKKPEDALKIAYNSDIFLLTSRWEGLSVSLLESMYLAKTCIVSDIMGNLGVIRNGENGFICQSLTDYVSAIQVVSDNYTIHNTNLGLTAKKDIIDIYNTEVMVKKYMNIYHSELANLI